MSKMRFRLPDLSTFRTELMGIGTIGVLMCHFGVHCRLPEMILRILSFGNQCVDIFLLVSGIGMYVSLQKRNDSSLKEWYLIRAKKVFLPYLLVAIPFYIWSCLYLKEGPLAYLGYVSTLNYWIGKDSMWYIALLVPLYLATPLVFRFVGKGKYSGLKAAVLIIGLLTVCAVDIPFYEESVNTIVICVQQAMKRVPLFVLGLYLGRFMQANKDEQGKGGALLFGGAIAAYLAFVLIPLFNNFYRGGAVAICFCAVCCVAFKWKLFPKCVAKILKWFGKRSLESYLANCVLVPFLFSFNTFFAKIDPYYLTYYVCVIIFGILLTQIIYQMGKWIKTKHGNRKIIANI